MSNELTPMKSEFAALLNDLDTMQQSYMYAARRTVLKEAEGVIVRLEQENAALRARLEEQIQRARNYEGLLTCAEEAIGHYQADVVNLTAKLGAMMQDQTHALVDLTAKLQASERENGNLKTCQCDGCSNSLDDADAFCLNCMSKLRAKLADAQENLEAHIQATTQREQTIISLTARLEAMTKERELDQGALRAACKLQSDLEQQLAASEQRVKELEKQIRRMTTPHMEYTIITGRIGYDPQREQAEALNKQLTEAQATIERLESDNAAARGLLLVSLDDAPPGSLANKLVLANRILRSERNQLQATIARLETLAYLGEHHFPDLTYKARLEELFLDHRKLESERDQLQATVTAQGARIAKLETDEYYLLWMEALDRETAQGEEIGKLREALRYMSREDNWTKEDGSYQMRRPGGAQREGIFISSHFLNPWVYAREALAGGKERI